MFTGGDKKEKRMQHGRGYDGRANMTRVKL